MTGNRLLGLDAVYCFGAGAIAVVFAAPLGRLFHAPALVLALVGAGAIVWALVLALLARRDEWRRPVAVVAAANTVGAAAVAALAVVAPAAAARLLLAAVAFEVAAFAALQVAALRR